MEVEQAVEQPTVIHTEPTLTNGDVHDNHHMEAPEEHHEEHQEEVPVVEKKPEIETQIQEKVVSIFLHFSEIIQSSCRKKKLFLRQFTQNHTTREL